MKWKASLAGLLLLVLSLPLAAYYETVGFSRPALAKVEKKRLILRNQLFSSEPAPRPREGTAVTTYRQKVAIETKHLLPLKVVKAFDPQGQVIKPRALKRRLAKEMPVLVASDFNAVNPLLRKQLREDAIILVLPLPPPPPGTEPRPSAVEPH